MRLLRSRYLPKLGDARWRAIISKHDLYLRLALAEGRHEATARLLSYAAVARERAWHTLRLTRYHDEARAALASAMDAATLMRLRAEGER